MLPTARYALGAAHTGVGLGECRDAVDTQRGDRLVWWHRFVGSESVDTALDAAFGERAERLGHPNILPILDHGRWHGAPFVITERPEGQPLARWLAPHLQDGTWASLDEVRSLFDKVLQAVACAHRDKSDGVSLHGMLSPRSIYVNVTPDGVQAQVFDFGLVQWLGTRCPPAEGFADARSPEQRDDPMAVSAAADVFALAVLLVTLLAPHENTRTGRVWADLALRGTSEVKSILSQLRRDVPGTVWEELARALSAAPADRHPDADRLRSALRRLDWTPIADPPPARQTRGPAAVSHHTPARATALPSAMVADPASAPMVLRKSAESVHLKAPPPDLTPVATPVSVPIPEHTRPELRSFSEPMPATEILPDVTQRARTAIDLQSFATNLSDTEINDQGETVIRTFAVGGGDTVITDPTNAGPYGAKPAKPKTPTKVVERQKTLPPARRPMVLGTGATLSASASLSAAAASKSVPPPPPRKSTPRVPSATAPAPSVSSQWLAPPEKTAGVDLFAARLRPEHGRHHTLPLGLKIAPEEVTPVSVSLPAPPPSSADETGPRWTPAPTEGLSALEAAMVPLPLTELSTNEEHRSESLSPMWRAALPSSDPDLPPRDLFAAETTEMPLPVEEPLPRWRDPRFLAAAGFVSALVAFLVGLFILGPNPSP